MKLPLHRWFRYSAGFSAEWAAVEVEKVGAQRVFDPFAGVGTSLFAAEEAGASALGVDPHPFVGRVVRAKNSWWIEPGVLEERADQVLAVAAELSVDVDAEPALLHRCFRRESLEALVSIRTSLDKLQQADEVDDLLWLVLVSILRPCSHVGTANWQYLLPNKTKATVLNPYPAYSAQVKMFAQDMLRRQRSMEKCSIDFLEQDVRAGTSLPENWADFVITSPPYANNFDYADATRLEMTFLGEVASWGDLRSLRANLLHSSSQQMTGYEPERVLAEASELAPILDELTTAYVALRTVRESKAGKKAYHSMAVAYFYDMALAWRSIRHVAAPGASICFVVGDSAPYGVHLPVDRWLGELALASGFSAYEFEKSRDRNTKWKNRKHQVPLHEGMLWVSG